MAKVTFEFDPFVLANVKKPKGASKSEILEINSEVAEFILDAALDKIGSGSSPVRSGRWKRSLSKRYKKVKGDFSSANFANMELHGDMLDALKAKTKKGGKIEFGITKASETGKADGHNNHSGKSKLPPREFIPKKGGSFNKDIMAGIKDILGDFADGYDRSSSSST